MFVSQHVNGHAGESIPVPTWTGSQVGKSIPVQKWNSPQGRQVHHIDAAALWEHQMIEFLIC